ncbi:hypothetical protein CK203_027155 [Vitis vinifera]|uniref:Uncharacterized protein n=1 Tax=Vitis vinifera TaxID=29760 RepID=A0A438I692_VITVI|nr:hypothetical protein CK203_027155 [Vitis vinifera]
MSSTNPYYTGKPGSTGPWNTGLCNCCSDVKTCMFSGFCSVLSLKLHSYCVVGDFVAACSAVAMLYAIVGLSRWKFCPSCLYHTKMRKQFMLRRALVTN